MHQLPWYRQREDHFLSIRGLALVFGVIACASRAPNTADSVKDDAVRVTLDVGAHRIPCQGEERTLCLRVRVLPDTSWRTFHDPIEEFTFEEGYLWCLDVERRVVP